jgi:hypothetical protein
MSAFILAAALFASQVSPDGDTANVGVAAVKVDAQGVSVDAPGADVRIDANGVTTNAGTTGVKVNAQGVEIGAGGASVKVAMPDVPTSVVEGRTALKQDRPAPTQLSNISVSGNVKSYACKAGEGVSIQSTASVYTLSGPCDTVRISGTGNSVTVAQVRRLEVSGIGNVVKWKQALEGASPIAVVTGTGHVVSNN